MHLQETSVYKYVDSDNKLMNREIQYTKSLPIFIGSHFISYHPCDKISNYTAVVSSTENSLAFISIDSTSIYLDNIKPELFKLLSERYLLYFVYCSQFSLLGVVL